MNLLWLQDTNWIYRNLFHFYCLTVKYKLRKTTPITITSIYIYSHTHTHTHTHTHPLGISLPKEVNNRYLENCKMKETEYGKNRKKNILCSLIGKINTNMTMLPKTIYRFRATHIKIPMALFKKLEKNSLKIFMETQKTYNKKKCWERRTELEKSWSLTSD